MIPIKVYCECGQHYAFDVEPINGRMPCAVACPACGQDGTTSANAIIAGQLPPPPGSPANNATLHVVNSAPPAPGSPIAPGRSDYLRSQQLGLVDHEQAKHEARAKTMWGDPPEKVISYLMIQGFNHQEASELVQALSEERKVAVRANGVRKIGIGCGLICVPVAAFLFFLHIRIMPIKIMGIALAVGLWGAWMLINGIIMVAVPKMESGDLADQ
jgi:hypothetical protein